VLKLNASICCEFVNVRNVLQQFVFDLDSAFADQCGWWRGVVVIGVRRMNKVNARRARLVPGWVTVFGRVYHFGTQQAN